MITLDAYMFKNSDDKQILDTIYVRINSYMFFKRIFNQPLQEV